MTEKKIRTARTANEHIAKIAALPRGINICVFLRSLLALIKCWNAATSAICHHVSRQQILKVPYVDVIMTKRPLNSENLKNRKMTRIKVLGFLLLFFLITEQTYSQKCYYDYIEKDQITGEMIKGNTIGFGCFIGCGWIIGLNKHGNRYFVDMHIKLSGSVRDVITPKNSIIFKLENGEIITIYANEEYVPSSSLTPNWGWGQDIVSWFNARYYISEEDIQKIASSRLTYIRASVGTDTYDESLSKRKGKVFQKNAKCILL